MTLGCRADRVVEQWTELEDRAQAVYDRSSEERKPAFFELVLAHTKLLANLNKLYVAGESRFEPNPFPFLRNLDRH